MKVNKKLDPSHSKDEALRYLKKIIKYMNSSTIEQEQFLNTLQKSSESVNQAFQQILFGECDGWRTIDVIEKSLIRFRSLFVENSDSDIRKVYNLTKLAGTKPVTCTSPADVYNTAHFTRLFAPQLHLEFYRYITGNSTSKEIVMKSVKLLRSKYSKERKWLHRIQKRCTSIFGGKPQLCLEEFSRVIQYEKQLSEKIFRLFDKSNTGCLSLKELYQGLVGILTSDTAGRIRYLFHIYDSDGNGTLNKQEVGDVLRMCISESNLQLREELVQELCDIVWNNVTADLEDTGEISFDHFHSVLLRYPAVYENLNVDLIGTGNFGQVFRFLEKPRKPTFYNKMERRWIQCTGTMKTNASLAVTIGLYIVLSIALVIQRIDALLPRSIEELAFIFAKCAGQLLNMNIALVLLLTLKHTVTKLRKTFMRRVIPFNEFQLLHTMVAYIIMVLWGIHVVAHVVLIVVNVVIVKKLSNTYFIEGDIGVVFFTGVALILVAAAFLISTKQRVKKYSYEIFIRTHQVSAVCWLVLMCFHGSNFWKWIVGPAFLFIAERIYFIWSTTRHRTLIETGHVHGNITQLTITKPTKFKYSPGDYVNINIPAISKTEWHPFTISSSLDLRTDHFTLHIRKAGNWTGKLHSTVKSAQKTQNPVGQINAAYDEEKKIGGLDISTISPTAFHVESDTLPPLYTDLELENLSLSTLGELFPNIQQQDKQKQEKTLEQQEKEQKQQEKTQEQPLEREKKATIIIGGDDTSLQSDSAFVSDSQSDDVSYNWSVESTESMRRNVPPVQRLMMKSKSVSFFDRQKSNAGLEDKQKTMSRVNSRSSITAINMEDAAPLDWRVFLDGPYSTPSHDILKTRHAILVAGGIGITPFSSVLESVIQLLKQRKRLRKCDCETPHTTWADPSVALQRIDFFWVTRDQASFSWFHQIFREIEEQQRIMGIDPPLINIHIYLTGLKKSEDIRGTFLQLAFEMIYQEESLDVLSGLRAKTKPGRPEWHNVLKEITRHDDSLTCPNGPAVPSMRSKLYTCGPAALAQELKNHCYKQNITFSEEIF